MQVAVFGRNLEVTPALRQYAEKKLRKLEKYVAVPLSAQVTFAIERGRHIVEVTVPLGGLILRGEEASDNMYASIDLVADKLEKQLVKYKSRVARRRTAAAAGAEDLTAGEVNGSVEEAEPADRVVRVKRFILKPQTIDEAVMQMNLLGHDFYVFTNAETNQVAVVYRRKDGNYGLIEPEQ